MPDTTDHAQVTLPPPIVFLAYLISAIALQWVVPFPFPWPVVLRILGGVLLIAGFVLAASAIREMRRMHTTPDIRQPVSALVTEGPYRFTRNPIYLGFLLIYLGFTLLAGTLWGIILSPFLVGTVTHWIIHAEEDYLSGKFEDEYAEYRTRVRQWI